MSKSHKKGIFSTLMIVIGSMIGVGILIVPNTIIPYGFAGILGWILASICSLVFAQIFSDITVANGESAKGGGLSSIARLEYGDRTGFLVGLSHWVFYIISASLVIRTFMQYLSTFYIIESDATKFIICSSIIIVFTVMHSLTSFAFKLLSGITLMKLSLFIPTALLGIIFFNASNVFGVPYNTSSGLLVNAYEGLTLNSNSIWDAIPLIFKSASLALLAFAGLESAVASSESIRDPKTTIPIATILGVAISSFVFVCTHIFVVNALGSTIDNAPVRKAVEVIMSNTFGESIGQIAGNFVKVAAVISCLGSTLVMLFVSSNVLQDTIFIADEEITNISERAHTGFPVLLGFISSTCIIVFVYLGYFVITDMSLIASSANFLLVYAYFQCVLVNLTRSKDIVLNLCGIAACAILFIGFDKKTIFYGVSMLLFGEVIYALLSRHSRKSSHQGHHHH